MDTCFLLHIAQDIKLEPPKKKLGLFVQNYLMYFLMMYL